MTTTQRVTMAALTLMALSSPSLAFEYSGPFPDHHVTVPGGQLDKAYFGQGDVFVGEPRRATPSDPACEPAEAYVTHVSAGNHQEVAALFNDNAVILEPTREVVSGRDAVDAFYSQRIQTMKPRLMPVAYTATANHCMVALAAQVDVCGEQRFVLVSIDHFTLGENGRFDSMVAYTRPTRKPECR